jgi:hypothetical protein
MDRLPTLLLIVAFTGGPISGSTCLRFCAHDRAAAMLGSSCHGEAAPEHRIAPAHDCLSHVGPLALAAKRTEPPGKFNATATVVPTSSLIRPVEHHRDTPARNDASSPPLVVFLGPLRI